MRAYSLGFILILCGCGSSFENAPHAQTAGYFDGYEVRWDKKSLSVCWEKESSAVNDLDFYKGITREVVTSQYQRAGFTFTGWNTCKEDSVANIRVYVNPHVWPKVQSFGKNLDQLARGMELTFDFLAAGNGWGIECLKPSNLANCVRNFALHEFGHSLGLKHEADRDDASCEQKTYSPGLNIGDYDQFSVMNYCNNEADVRANQPPVLSYHDVATLLQVYEEDGSSSTFAAIAWSPSTGTFGTSWHWRNQGAADNTAIGNCEKFANQARDCRVMAWAMNACAAFAVGQNKGYGWAWHTEREQAKNNAMQYCQQNHSDCRVVAAVCSQD